MIAVGAVMLWAAITDRQSDIIDQTARTVAQPGFVGMMAIFAVLMSMATVSAQTARVAAGIGFIVAFGFAKSQNLGGN